MTDSTPNDLVLLGRRVIDKEAVALAGLAQSLDLAFATACNQILSCQGTVTLTGIGKSGIVARKWASTFSSTGTRAYFINPAEAQHGDLGILRSGDVLIALSYSGETEELTPILRHAQGLNVPIVGVTGNPVSSLAQATATVLSVRLSEEACPLGLAPTVSTTLMMALGDALAMTLMQMRGFTERDFAKLHPGGALGRRHWLTVGDLMHGGDRIPRVGPGAGFDEVLVEMTAKCLGIAVVIEGRQILGVITDGDLRRCFQQNRISPGVEAYKLMTPSPRSVPESGLAHEAREVMERHSIHQLLVVDSGKNLVGVLHLHDLLRAKVL